ncbi:Crp/Fnr family transcriptional regulator [Paracoccus sediminis]|uniref:Crp/Fnr family transcriptional regulator n=1 Tax=Paracoccus sediminis TaxID=1214787 RepID=A0A238VFF9_9RHOB|nr:Crp/Fnr family transcriptional regulator [Paracoccus sediminis]TBN52007.1 Crp/Fnr family transcriptional regulator [Paracoccus sediminis]SNR32908.1 cAMP-binding domain of CRP or a regulatory subunit of cAMP-dependent protein kinases [Paracoccus sediminis]
MIDPSDYAHLFDAPILVGLSRDQKHALLSSCTARVLKSATYVLRQGETTTGSYFIASGRVEVGYVDSSGNQVIVHTAISGEMLGEVEALSGRPCAASCLTMPDTTVLFCPAKALYAHVPPQILIPNLCTILHDRLMRENRNRMADHYYNADQRIRLYLRQLTSDSDDGLLRISQSQLGVVIGCSRQTVNKMLGELRDEGIIELGRNAVRVLDRTRLEDGAPVLE